MKINKFQPTLTAYTGVGLMIIGGLVPGFLQLRPNRIEKGIGVSFAASVENHWILLLVVILMLFFFYLGASHFPKVKTSMPEWIIDLGQVVSGLLGLFSLFFISGSKAGELLANMERAARVSFGMGFWLCLLGSMLLIYQSLNKKKVTWWHRLAVLVTILLVFFLAYKMSWLTNLSLIREFESKDDRILREMARHMQLAVSASFTGLVLSIFLAGQAYRYPRRRGPVMSLVNMAQVVPTLTFLGLVMIPLTGLANAFPVLKDFGITGIGFVPAYIVLSMYTLLPMTTSILAGYNSISKDIVEAARGMGMTDKQIGRQVELPLVMPYLYAGFTTALIQAVGNTVIAGLVGGGGMGSILFLGLAQSAPDLVILSALMVVSVAMVLKWILSSLEPLIDQYFGQVTNKTVSNQDVHKDQESDFLKQGRKDSGEEVAND